MDKGSQFPDAYHDRPESLTAHEIIGSHALEDHEDLFGRFDFAGGDDQKLLDYKYENAKSNGLLDDVLKNGIHTPIDVHVDKEGYKTVTQGHHRLAIAQKHFPHKPIPIRYWEG
jgi:hypothetical protein